MFDQLSKLLGVALGRRPNWKARRSRDRHSLPAGVVKVIISYIYIYL